jgi:hypothetical protein
MLSYPMVELYQYCQQCGQMYVGGSCACTTFIYQMPTNTMKYQTRLEILNNLIREMCGDDMSATEQTKLFRQLEDVIINYERPKTDTDK